MNNNSRFSWEDARIFLCVAEHKSFTAAAKVLKIGQPTVSRRIQALEEQFETQLFIRGKYGAQATPYASSLIPAAQQMSKWALEFRRLANRNENLVSGTVTIAAPPGIAVEELAPFAANFKHQEPSIQLEILSSIDYVDLSRGSADIAIRTQAPLDSGLISLHKSNVRTAVMASSDYVDRLVKPYSIEDLDWVTWGGRYNILEPRVTLEKLIPNFSPSFSSDDYLVIKAALEAGAGASIISTPLGFSNSNLVELDIELNLPFTEFHIVCSKSVQQIPRVRRVINALIEAIESSQISN